MAIGPGDGACRVRNAPRVTKPLLPTTHLTTQSLVVIPKPFTKVFLLGGGPVCVPPDLGSDQLQQYVDRIQAEMDRLNAAAERLPGTAAAEPLTASS